MEKSAVIADERPAGVEGEEGDSRGKEKVRSGSREGGPKKESESSIAEERMGRAMKEATADVSDDNSENVSDDWYGNDDADLEKGTTLSRVKIYRGFEEWYGIEYQEKQWSSGTKPRGKTTTGKSWERRPGTYRLGITKFAFYNAHPTLMSGHQTLSPVINSEVKGNAFREFLVAMSQIRRSELSHNFCFRCPASGYTEGHQYAW